MVKIRRKKRGVTQTLQHLPSLRKTAIRMFEEGKITGERKQYIDSHIEEWVTDSKHTLFSLGVHISIAFVRFTILPFPLMGSTLRGLWTTGCRIYYTLKRDLHKKHIHSFTVLFVSLIPFLGYFAYTIPLKKECEYLAYLYAEHISYHLYDKPLEV